MMQATRNPHDLAMFKLVSVEEARQMIIREDSYLLGWGKTSLQQHIISRRKLSDKWPRADSARLGHFRKLHDQGKVTMCQGRDGEYMIQYAIPSEQPHPNRPPYFSERNL